MAAPAAPVRWPRWAQAIAIVQNITAGTQLIPLVLCTHSSVAWEVNSSQDMAAVNAARAVGDRCRGNIVRSVNTVTARKATVRTVSTRLSPPNQAASA